MKEHHALYLPAGSVRGIIALLFVGTVCYLALKGFDAPKFLEIILSVIVGFYFAKKQDK